MFLKVGDFTLICHPIKKITSDSASCVDQISPYKRRMRGGETDMEAAVDTIREVKASSEMLLDLPRSLPLSLSP